jgi:tetratricopeptide (TPR) repeat protein
MNKLVSCVVIISLWLSGNAHSESAYAPSIGPPELGVLMTLKQRLWFDAAKAEHLGKWKEVLAITERWQTMRPGDIELWVYRARALGALQLHKEAEAAYMRVLEQYPNEDFIFLALAELSEQQGNIKAACQHVVMAIGIHPDYADALSFHERVCNEPEGQGTDTGDST